MLEDIGYKIMKEEGGGGKIVSCARYCFQRGGWVSTPAVSPDSNLCIGGVVNEQQAHSLKLQPQLTTNGYTEYSLQ